MDDAGTYPGRDPDRTPEETALLSEPYTLEILRAYPWWKKINLAASSITLESFRTMPGYESDEVIGQTGVPRSCCGSGPPRPINQSGGHAQLSSGLERHASFQQEAEYTYASVAVPQPLHHALTFQAGPYIDHIRFIHSRGALGLLLHSDLLQRRL